MSIDVLSENYREMYEQGNIYSGRYSPTPLGGNFLKNKKKGGKNLEEKKAQRGNLEEKNEKKKEGIKGNSSKKEEKYLYFVSLFNICRTL